VPQYLLVYVRPLPSDDILTQIVIPERSVGSVVGAAETVSKRAMSRVAL
jgi:hypothetical protein